MANTRAQKTAQNLSTLTTAGDMAYASAAGTPARLGIGSTDQILKVTGGVPVWDTASSGALTKVRSTAFSAVANTSTSFDGVFTGTYENYQVVFVGRSSTACNLLFQFRVGASTQTSAVYAYGATINSSQVGSDVRSSPGSDSSITLVSLANVARQNLVHMYVSGVSTGASPVFTFHSGAYGNGLLGMQYGGGIFNSGASCDGFILSTSTGTMTGTVYVYGLAN